MRENWNLKLHICEEPRRRTKTVNAAGHCLNSFVAPQMQLAIMAARNRTKSFNLLQAGKVPAGGKDWFRDKKVRRRFGAGFK